MEPESPSELTIGGVSKETLRARLAAGSVSLNAYAELLFDAPEFTVSAREHRIDLVTVSLDDLGLPTGGTLPAIFERARSRGYAPCPLEVGPHLRLHLLDQQAGPYLTVASPDRGRMTWASRRASVSIRPCSISSKEFDNEDASR